MLDFSPRRIFLPSVRGGESGRRLVFRLGIFGLWMAVVVAGSVWLWKFSLEPGKSPAAEPVWPQASSLPRPGEPTLVVFLHPLCPCSRATVEELSVLLARTDGRLAVRAVFITAGMEHGKVETSGLWKQVQALPGVTLHEDSGAEAERFHAETSGDAFLFDSAGRLRFRGGLTAARGHAGDNFGVDSIVRILTERGTAAPAIGPVFGCALAGAPQLPATR